MDINPVFPGLGKIIIISIIIIITIFIFLIITGIIVVVDFFSSWFILISCQLETLNLKKVKVGLKV